MQSKRNSRGKALLVRSILACLLLATTAVQAAECEIPGTPGLQQGSCTLTCSAGGTLVDVQAWGVDARIDLVCPTSGTSIGCNSQSVVEPVAPLPDPPFHDPILGCRAFAQGNFSGVCECKTVGTGAFLVTSGRCFCN